jgi:hypothetical protein
MPRGRGPPRAARGARAGRCAPPREATAPGARCLGQARDPARLQAHELVATPDVRRARSSTSRPTRRACSTSTTSVRLVPGGTAVRRGAHLAKGVVVMPPAYVNVGAYVGEGHDGRQPRAGRLLRADRRNVHLSAGAQIGGVLEPAHEPGRRRGRRVRRRLCGVFEGVVVRERAVLAAGVVLTAATPSTTSSTAASAAARSRPARSSCPAPPGRRGDVRRRARPAARRADDRQVPRRCRTDAATRPRSTRCADLRAGRIDWIAHQRCGRPVDRETTRRGPFYSLRMHSTAV